MLPEFRESWFVNICFTIPRHRDGNQERSFRANILFTPSNPITTSPARTISGRNTTTRTREPSNRIRRVIASLRPRPSAQRARQVYQLPAYLRLPLQLFHQLLHLHEPSPGPSKDSCSEGIELALRQSCASTHAHTSNTSYTEIIIIIAYVKPFAGNLLEGIYTQHTPPAQWGAPGGL